LTFSSLVFIFIFLPVVLLLFMYIPGVKLKQLLIFLAGLIFYAWGSPKNLLLLLLSVVLHYATGMEIAKAEERGNFFTKKIMLFTTIGFDVLVLAVFKYAGLALPIGISFFTFSEISYIVDIYYGKVPMSANPLDTAMYVTFFPKLISGPIVQYADFKKQMMSLEYKKANISKGMNLFLIGLYKKVLLADNLGNAFAAAYAVESKASVTAWLGMIFYSLQLYFDFSGYSDMAIGLAQMFGFKFEKNFDYPYTSKNMSEFWRRWHISLGAWFRDYVYIPLGGNRCAPVMQFRNLAIVWILTGLWHGSTLNFLAWGIYHGIFVILEKFVIKKRLEFLPDAVKVLMTGLIAFVGWIFFFTPNLGGSFHYMAEMFGAGGGGFWNSTTTFLLKQNLLLLVISFILCGPYVKKLHDKYAFKQDGGYRLASIAIYIVLFLITIVYMVSATYQTFLYFQF